MRYVMFNGEGKSVVSIREDVRYCLKKAVSQVSKVEIELDYGGNEVVSALQELLYLNESRENSGNAPIAINVLYDDKYYSLEDFDSEIFGVLTEAMNHYIVEENRRELVRTLKLYLKKYNITDEELEYIQSDKFYADCSVYDIELPCSSIGKLKMNVTTLDDRALQKLGLPRGYRFVYNYDRLTDEYIYSLVDKVKGYLSLKFYRENEDLFPVDKIVITNNSEYRVITKGEDIPLGWYSTRLTVGEENVYPACACEGGGRNRKVGDEYLYERQDMMD